MTPEQTSAFRPLTTLLRRLRSLRMGVLLGGIVLGALTFEALALAPGAIELAQAAPAKKAEKVPRPQVTFTGFHEFQDGSARIWVRLTKAVNVEEHAAKGKVTFVLKGAKVPGRNNKNPLITSHFTSSVMSARLHATKHDAELVITLKQDVAPKHRVVSRPDGTISVQIDFPAPVAGAETYPVPPDEPPPAPAADKK